MARAISINSNHIALTEPQRGVSAVLAEIPVGGIWGGEAPPMPGGAGGSSPRE